MTVRLLIEGAPVSWKNSHQLVRRKNGMPGLVKNRGQQDWIYSAVAQLRRQWRDDPITVDVAASYDIYLGPRQRLDLDNAMLGVGDALERAGVIRNDRQIVCLQGRKYMDQRDYPRVEIELELIGQGDGQGRQG